MVDAGESNFFCTHFFVHFHMVRLVWWVSTFHGWTSLQSPRSDQIEQFVPWWSTPLAQNGRRLMLPAGVQRVGSLRFWLPGLQHEFLQVSLPCGGNACETHSHTSSLPPREPIHCPALAPVAINQIDVYHSPPSQGDHLGCSARTPHPNIQISRPVDHSNSFWACGLYATCVLPSHEPDPREDRSQFCATASSPSHRSTTRNATSSSSESHLLQHKCSRYVPVASWLPWS